MTRSDQKVLQYLKEARASELALTRVLQSQIAMTPGGPFRSALEQHLEETRGHAQRLQARTRELQQGFHPVLLAVGLAEGVVGQALALSKTPLDLVRGTSGEEKVLKNAKDAAATETLEIATYLALEQLARHAGDGATAELAASIRADEERMLDRVLALVPALTDAVFAADVWGDSSYDVSDTGAADAVRHAGTAVKDAAEDARDAAKAKAEKARKAAKAKADAARKATKAKADSARETAEAKADDARKAAAEGAAKVESVADDVATSAVDAAKDVAGKAEDVAGDAKDAADGLATAASDTVQEAAVDAKQMADRVTSAAAETVGNAAEKAEETAEDVTSAVADGVQDAAEATEDRADDAAADSAGDAEKPWAGYDELSVEEVRAVLLTADVETAREVIAYETEHDARAEVLADAERKVPAAKR